MDLPKSNVLRRVCQAMATLDALIMQEWEFRYYSHNSRWDPQQEMASMRNGSGDHYCFLFTVGGGAFKGYWRDAETARRNYSKQKFYEGLPSLFTESFLNEPAF